MGIGSEREHRMIVQGAEFPPFEGPPEGRMDNVTFRAGGGMKSTKSEKIPMHLQLQKSVTLRILG